MKWLGIGLADGKQQNPFSEERLLHDFSPKGLCFSSPQKDMLKGRMVSRYIEHIASDLFDIKFLFFW
jgi:hypothetical protein